MTKILEWKNGEKSVDIELPTRDVLTIMRGTNGVVSLFKTQKDESGLKFVTCFNEEEFLEAVFALFPVRDVKAAAWPAPLPDPRSATAKEDRPKVKKRKARA